MFKRLTLCALTLTLLGTTAVALVTAPEARADEKTPWIHVSVTENGGEKANVNVNLPLSLMEVALDIAQDEILVDGNIELEHCDVSVADMRRMWTELRDAGDADFITAEQDDETVRIRREGNSLYVDVDGKGSDAEKVRIEVPLSVVDALFEGDGNALNLRAALTELQKTTEGEILSVQDGEDRVRVWID